MAPVTSVSTRTEVPATVSACSVGRDVAASSQNSRVFVRLARRRRQGWSPRHTRTRSPCCLHRCPHDTGCHRRSHPHRRRGTSSRWSISARQAGADRQTLHEDEHWTQDPKQVQHVDAVSYIVHTTAVHLFHYLLLSRISQHSVWSEIRDVICTLDTVLRGRRQK